MLKTGAVYFVCYVTENVTVMLISSKNLLSSVMIVELFDSSLTSHFFDVFRPYKR